VAQSTARERHGGGGTRLTRRRLAVLRGELFSGVESAARDTLRGKEGGEGRSTDDDFDLDRRSMDAVRARWSSGRDGAAGRSCGAPAVCNDEEKGLGPSVD
jgi:hypothetical protein